MLPLQGEHVEAGQCSSVSRDGNASMLISHVCQEGQACHPPFQSLLDGLSDLFYDTEETKT